MTAAINLRRETEAAKSLLLNMRDVIGDDEQASADMIEGETNLFEAVAAAVERVQELETHAKALADRVKDLGQRKKRMEDQADMLRAAVLSAMGAAEIKKIELPIATVSRRPTAPSVTITEESDIPADFWQPQPPKLDKKLLLAALKDAKIPGAELSNGGETLSIRSV